MDNRLNGNGFSADIYPPSPSFKELPFITSGTVVFDEMCDNVGLNGFRFEKLGLVEDGTRGGDSPVEFGRG